MSESNKTIRSLLDLALSGLSIVLFFAAMALVLALLYFVWHFLSQFLVYIKQMKPEAAATVIAASFTVLGSVTAVVIGQVLSRRREIVEAYRIRKLELYEKLIDEIADAWEVTKGLDEEVLRKKLNRIHENYARKMMLWSSGKVIRKFNAFIDLDNLKMTHRNVALGDLTQELRADVGQSDGFLERIQLLLLYRKPKVAEHGAPSDGFSADAP